MNRIILLIILLASCFPVNVKAQIVNPNGQGLRTVPYKKYDGFTVQSHWRLQEGQMALNPISIQMRDTIALSLSSDGGDVLLSFQLPEPKVNHRYLTKLMVLPEGEEQYLTPFENYLYHSEELKQGELVKDILWSDVLDRYGVNEGDALSVKVLVDVEISRPPRPRFSRRQKRPFYASTVIGVGLLAAGVVYKNKADNVYENQYQTQFFRDKAEPYYEEATDQRNKALMFFVTGGVVVVSSVTMFVVKRMNVRIEQRQWDQNYADSYLGFQPTILPQVDGALAAGVHLNYSF